MGRTVGLPPAPASGLGGPLLLPTDKLEQTCVDQNEEEPEYPSPLTMLSKGQLPKLPQLPESLILVREASIPFLVAGLGMVAAGLLLSEVKSWQVFVEINELLILVPALLGLKGNLEMTLAARLGTHANMGQLDNCEGFCRIAGGNLAVVQCQAIVVGFLASLVAFFLDVVTTHTFHPGHSLLMAAASVTTASVASLLLASIMILIVVLARRFGIDPDNIASPIAGMLGDFCTLGLLSFVANILFITSEDFKWVQYAILFGYTVLALFVARVAHRNEFTRTVLIEGWVPVVVSMLVSSMGGLVLKNSIREFHGLAPFAPVMNGAGGNLAAVQSSRISTDLHRNTQGKSALEDDDMPTRKMSLRRPSGAVGAKTLQNLNADLEQPILLRLRTEEVVTPKATFQGLFGKDRHAGSARVLIGLTVPGALCFVTLIVHVRSGGLALPDPIFMVVYIMAALCQVSFLFVVAHGIVASLWKKGLNPDNAAIPYVTSLGDFVGTLCLSGAFLVLSVLEVQPWPGAAGSA